MKQSLLICLFGLLILSACQKNDAINDTKGSWKLTEVFDKNTNSVIHPIPGSDMDVVITFLNTTEFAGHTLRNALSNGVYSQTGNYIIFKAFSMTKIAEDTWGENFLTVLNACSLQSTTPCSPSKILIEGNTMKIFTSLRYDITLQKI
jgi:hypothetical protein